MSRFALLKPLWVAVGLSLMAPPTLADITLVGRSAIVAMNLQGAGQEKVWLDSTQVRRDLLDRGKAYSNLYDMKAHEITVLDHSQHLATVYDMTVLKQQLHVAVDEKAIKLDLQPTGRRHMLKRWPCIEHRLDFAMPAEVGEEKLSFEMAGTVWLAKNTPEQKETAAVLKLMQAPDFFMGVPGLNRSSQIQAQGLSVAVRRIAPLGLLCSVDVDMKYEGSGRVAALSKKMTSRVSLTFDDYDTTPIAKGTFEIPQGYRVVRQ